MTTAAPIIGPVASTEPVDALRGQVSLTAIYAVVTIAMAATVTAAFVALVIEGGGGRHAQFALVAGSLAFAALVLIQFVHWSGVLLGKLRRAK